MDQNESGLRNFNEGRPMQGSGMRRLFPIGVGAAILIVAAIIFSSAGSDRTRTAQNNNPNTAASRQAAPDSAIPPSSGGAPGKQEVPQRSNPAGTQ
jgi:hypothetical protein